MCCWFSNWGKIGWDRHKGVFFYPLAIELKIKVDVEIKQTCY